MPIYEYECKKCQHRLDALQKMADEPLVDCPECGQPALKRLLSAPRFRLKGSGWYETDFKSDKQRNLAGDKESAKTDSAASSEKSASSGEANKTDKTDKTDKKDASKSDATTAAKPAKESKSQSTSPSSD